VFVDERYTRSGAALQTAKAAGRIAHEGSGKSTGITCAGIRGRKSGTGGRKRAFFGTIVPKFGTGLLQVREFSLEFRHDRSEPIWSLFEIFAVHPGFAA
jgi:hypothetical protein